jgi:hypothetical protein
VATFPDGDRFTQSFSAIRPTAIDYVFLRHDVIPPVGVFGLELRISRTFKPAFVSFGNTETREVGTGPQNPAVFTGKYFTDGAAIDPASNEHIPRLSGQALFFQTLDSNEIEGFDVIGTHEGADQPASVAFNGPYPTESVLTWPIPHKVRRKGGGQEFDLGVVSTQIFKVSTVGKLTMTKEGGGAKVTVSRDKITGTTTP